MAYDPLGHIMVLRLDRKMTKNGVLTFYTNELFQEYAAKHINHTRIKKVPRGTFLRYKEKARGGFVNEAAAIILSLNSD